MEEITDEYMRNMLASMRRHTVVILRRTPKRDEPGAEKIVWEHGRRNFELRSRGKLRIVCPVEGRSDVSGLCIFSAGVDETVRMMDDDPTVKAGIYTYEAYSVLGFPGDSLS